MPDSAKLTSARQIRSPAISGRPGRLRGLGSARLAVVVVAAAALLAGCGGIGNEGSTGGYVSGSRYVSYVEPKDRKPAPKLSGASLDGEPLSSADYQDKTLVVNVWGSWCPPCRAEAPVLNAVAEEYAEEVQFLGLNVRDDLSAARAFERRSKTPYPSIVDTDGRLQLGFSDSLPSQAIPTTWVIDVDGKVAARIIDPDLAESTLTEVIDQVQQSVDGDS